MDPFKLLSRSTKISRRSVDKTQQHLPPSGRVAQPQLFSASASTSLGKRKRDIRSNSSTHRDESLSRFFATSSDPASNEKPSPDDDAKSKSSVRLEEPIKAQHFRASLDERKRVLKQHKVKVKIFNSDVSRKRNKPRASKEKKADRAWSTLLPSPLLAMKDLNSQFDLSYRLSQNILQHGYKTPTEVQLAALPLLLDNTGEYMPESATSRGSKLCGNSSIDFLTVAPTGSGKTLAFMIPLIQSILSRRQEEGRTGRRTSAIILAPTKELASQITNEGRKLSKETGVSVSLIKKGMKLADGRDGGTSIVPQLAGSSEQESTWIVTKADIVVSTPGILQKIISEAGGSLSDVRNLVLDEADVLLDPTFREQTMAIWNSLTEPNLRVSMWSATMGSSIEEFVISTIAERRKHLSETSGIDIGVAPIIRLVVGLKDSAVPNVSHQLIYAATEKGKLMGLRQLLNPKTSSADSGPALRPPFLIFTQTVKRAIALSSELIYDVPSEAGGSNRIAVLHSDLSDSARDNIMIRFRRGEIWILITTDLLSRGVDFRGVNGVVNYDIPTSSAAYVHRIGRTGRGGRDGGVAVTLYAKEDVPYMKHVANVVSLSQKNNGSKEGAHQWLLDALPKLSKNEKKNLKNRGIESGTVKSQKGGPNAAQKSRISTKAGFIRRAENRRKGAVLGAQRKLQAESRSADEVEFSGFD